jgi:hypothetical protein
MICMLSSLLVPELVNQIKLTRNKVLTKVHHVI